MAPSEGWRDLARSNVWHFVAAGVLGLLFYGLFPKTMAWLLAATLTYMFCAGVCVWRDRKRKPGQREKRETAK